MFTKFKNVSLLKYNRYNKITKAKQIKKELIKNAILFDPLVDENFYCYRLKQLSINNSQIELLYDNVGKDIYSLMALIRGEQIGLIDKNFVHKVITSPSDVKWLINSVKIKMHKLLGLDQIKRMCHDNPGLYELAVKKRINGSSYDEVCDFVQYHIIIDKNKE